MRTNWFRRTFSFVAGASIMLAACLLVFAGCTAVAQSGGGDLQAAVSSALAHDAMLKNQPVTASTANGVVTLTGTVETCLLYTSTPDFERVFGELYPQCENISVDYAILEPRSAKGEHHSNLYCIPARFGWSDLGSWAALHEFQVDQKAADEHSNCLLYTSRCV